MKQAIIDIGSNSMRMTVYEIGENDFSPLFKEKVMVGLAGYVENGILSEEGIRCAYEKLAGFKRTLDLLGISDVKAFATASLRNVANSAEAAAAIKAAASLSVEVLSGEEEALYSYKGAMRELHICDGVFVDTGGASTEIVLFSDGKIKEMQSFGVGALNLYKKCVRKIIRAKSPRSGSGK